MLASTRDVLVDESRIGSGKVAADYLREPLRKGPKFVLHGRVKVRDRDVVGDVGLTDSRLRALGPLSAVGVVPGTRPSTLLAAGGSAGRGSAVTILARCRGC